MSRHDGSSEFNPPVPMRYMGSEARCDREVYCPMRARSVLVIDQTCFARSRDRDCILCRLDTEPILVKLLWELLNSIEDSAPKKREGSK